ncbi:MAG: OmpH family outer membrane protein [Spirochaetales bacterium]|jgi:Skp family chaperone for outer membrane proteins|nr:OmpH family outer membrane protein [Exilispira sp.]NMC66694.1 OmpH family outer membrane protein [Spirochaetales bacterium]
MSKKRILIPLLLLILILLTFLSADFIKVAVVDMEFVLKEYKITLVDIKRQFYIDEMTLKFEKIKAEIDAINQKLSSPNLTSEEKTKLEQNRQDKLNEVIQLRDYYKKLDEDLQQNRQKYIMEDIYFSIKKVCEKKGYALAFDSKMVGILFYADYIDISKDVLEYLFIMIVRFLKDNNVTNPERYGIDPNLYKQYQ